MTKFSKLDKMTYKLLSFPINPTTQFFSINTNLFPFYGTGLFFVQSDLKFCLRTKLISDVTVKVKLRKFDV